MAKTTQFTKIELTLSVFDKFEHIPFNKCINREINRGTSPWNQLANHYKVTCQPYFYLLDWVPLPVRGQTRATLSGTSVLETVYPAPPLWSGGEPSEDAGLVLLWFNVDVSTAEALLSSQYPGSLHFFFFSRFWELYLKYKRCTRRCRKLSSRWFSATGSTGARVHIAVVGSWIPRTSLAFRKLTLSHGPLNRFGGAVCTLIRLSGSI